ncbi:hypothetical protein [Cellulomonas alba]|uniref:Uncharacterized protein n=1 Tax=Cellulomonas alba TaxID=3053467 RepID=A0ABT7SEY0_9CELL|nr:hypothetical protein [Cellulomonas alba]MDM7854752.1 hypothetical protein [Cellulomonas alba]
MTTPTHLRASRTRPGLVLYVSIPDETATPTASGASAQAPDARQLTEAAELLRELAVELLPTAETYTALALAPQPARTLLRLLDGRHPDALAGSGDPG